MKREKEKKRAEFLPNFTPSTCWGPRSEPSAKETQFYIRHSIYTHTPNSPREGRISSVISKYMTMLMLMLTDMGQTYNVNAFASDLSFGYRAHRSYS